MRAAGHRVAPACEWSNMLVVVLVELTLRGECKNARRFCHELYQCWLTEAASLFKTDCSDGSKMQVACYLIEPLCLE
jgi:hypothetical protein